MEIDEHLKYTLYVTAIHSSPEMRLSLTFISACNSTHAPEPANPWSRAGRPTTSCNCRHKAARRRAVAAAAAGSVREKKREIGRRKKTSKPGQPFQAFSSTNHATKEKKEKKETFTLCYAPKLQLTNYKTHTTIEPLVDPGLLNFCESGHYAGVRGKPYYCTARNFC
jgi:hypothetical protein